MTVDGQRGGGASLVYLHGFASSPASAKAVRFRAAFEARGWEVIVPDLNPPDFRNLTVGGMLRVTEAAVDGARGPVVLGGASLGGYVAAVAASRLDGIRALVLLAPAFDLRARWADRLGPGALAAWKRFGSVPIHHDAYDRECPLAYEFYDESRKYPAFPANRATPQIIFHGRDDDTVPLATVERYVERHPDAEFHVLDDDHALLETIDSIVAASIEFVEPLCRVES